MKKNTIIITVILIFGIKLFSFTWPVPLTSTPFESAYGSRILSGSYDFHNGMDIESPMYTDVRAAHSGSVSYIDNNSAGPEGRMISLINTLSGAFDYKTCYMHLNSLNVALYAQVYEGNTVIAESGDTGSGGAHLHFEYRVSPGGMNVDDRHPMGVMPDVPDITGPGIVISDFSFVNHHVYCTLNVHEKHLDLNRVSFICYTNGRTAITIEINYNERIPPDIINAGVLYITDEITQTDFTITITPHNFTGASDQIIDYHIARTSNLNQVFTDLVIMVYDADGNLVSTAPSNSENELICQKTSLGSNIPNPFNPSTTISYNLSENIHNPKIEIYNVKGQKVKSFQLEEKAGESSIVWNGKDENDKSVSSGVYFYQLINAGKTVQTRKMLLMK